MERRTTLITPRPATIRARPIACALLAVVAWWPGDATRVLASSEAYRPPCSRARRSRGDAQSRAEDDAAELLRLVW